MTDIKVILDTGPHIDISALSQEERDLLFEQIAADNPDIPRVVMDAFAEMQTIIMQDDNRFTKPDLKELLLRKIIHLSQNHGSEYNTVVIPIIPSFAAAGNFNATNTQHVEAASRQPSSQLSEKTGSAIPPMRRMKPQERKAKEEIPGAVKIRFDSQIFSMTANNRDYIVPPGEELDVIGIIFNPICSQLRAPDSRGDGLPTNAILTPSENTSLNAVVVDPPEIGSRLLTGRYSYPEASRACDNFFAPLDYGITIAGEYMHRAFKIMFAELDDKKITRALSAVFDYLADAESYHHSDIAAQFIHAQLDAAISGKAGATKKLRAVFDLPEYPAMQIATEEADKAPIFEVLESIHYGKFNSAYNLSLLSDIYSRGFSRIYQRAAIKGKDDKEVIAGITLHKEKKARVAFQIANEKKILDEKNKLNTYKLIIEKKLGAKRLAEIEHQLMLRPSLVASAKNILELLKPPERKPVEIEYERREKYLETVVNNKCPHVGLYRTFRHAKDDERARKLFKDLTKYFKNPHETSGMITCNNCGFDIICPHIREFTEMDLAGKFHTEIKARLTKYIDKAVVKDQYYCKICGEMISSLEAFGDVASVRDPSSTMNEELKNFMWGEIAILTKHLKFGNLVNVPQLITAARDACYPFIFEIEKQILKSKTNSAEEIKSKKRLYVTIYAFAYFVHLILSNKGKSGENDITFKNFTPKNPKSAIVDLIRHSLGAIILSRNVAIRDIPGMSHDIIKNTLIEAYKSMQSVGAQVIIYSGESEDLLATLLLDPIYRYYYTVNIIDDIIHGKRAPGLAKRNDMVNKVDIIMGEPLAKLEKIGKTADIYSRAAVPKFDKWDAKKFDEIKPLTGGKMTVDGKIPGKLIFEDSVQGYVARSFELFSAKQTSRSYTEPLYVDVSAVGRADPNAPMEVKFRPLYEKQREQFLDFEAKETELLKYKSLAYAQNYKFLPAIKSRRWRDPGATLSRIYDEDGNPHKWDIFIVEKSADGKLERKEYKNSEIVAMTESGTQFTDTITDRKCSTCGLLWSTVDKLSESKIHDSLHAKHMVSNFFRFYENRCPKGGLHEFGDNGVCAKCTMLNSFITFGSSAEALSYYRQHKDIYLREREEFAAREAPVESAKTAPVDITAYKDEYDKWTPNFNIVLDLANKLKVNHRLLSALGAVEKQEYADVQSGTYIPPEIDERHATRIFVVDTHVKNLITEYNQVRFFHRLVKPPMDLSTLIDSSGINKHKIAELSKKLPDVFNDYNARFSYIQRSKKPREIVSFCIQYFCEICLTIWNDNDKETEKLRHDFVSYIVKKILRGEELLTKPGHFNWSLLYGDKETKEKDYDMNLNKDLGDDRNVNEPEEDDFGDASAPLSTEAFDMEEDGEERDDDDSGNGIRVGENLGLV